MPGKRVSRKRPKKARNQQNQLRFCKAWNNFRNAWKELWQDQRILIAELDELHYTRLERETQEETIRLLTSSISLLQERLAPFEYAEQLRLQQESREPEQERNGQ